MNPRRATHTQPLNVRLFLATVSAIFMCSSLAAQDSTGAIRVVIVSGEGAEHRTGQECARMPLVRVEDGNGQPIEQAELLFRLPEGGPGGAFLDGAVTAKGRTNLRGFAAVPPFRLNKTAGEFEIQVEAFRQGQRGAATIHQSSRGRRGLGKKIAIISAVAAGGVGAAVAVSRRKDEKNCPCCGVTP